MADGSAPRHRLAAGALFLEVDAGLGGRVTAFGLGADNLLSGPKADALNFGSTFWTSPQTQWGWPPVAEIDSAPYGAHREGDILVLTGPASAALGVAVQKRFAIDGARGAVMASYRISNVGAEARMLAPWEVARVRPGGLTFFPTGDGVYPPSNLTVVETAGAIWFPYEPARISGHPKLFADAGRGWLAHVDVDAHLLLVKTFPVVPRAQQAPDEALIEIYAHPALTYVELEQQGAYKELAPGASSHWTVRWFLRRLDHDVVVAPGSASLLAAVEAVLAQGGKGFAMSSAAPFTVVFNVATPVGRCAGVALPPILGEDEPFVPPALLAALPAEEQAFAATLAVGRAVSWVGGRLALRAALAGAGDAPADRIDLLRPMLADDRGAPVLPPGVVGSISHKEGLAVGLVSTDLRWRVGLDLEDPRSLRRDISSRVLTPEEQVALAPLTGPDAGEETAYRAAVLARFAIKEAIYKALDPWLRRHIGFLEAAVQRTADGWSATFSPRAGEGAFALEIFELTPLAGIAPLILFAARGRRVVVP